MTSISTPPPSRPGTAHKEESTETIEAALKRIRDLERYTKREVDRDYEVKKLKEVFNTFDTDHDEALSRTEVEKLLHHLGELNAKEQQETMEELFRENTKANFDSFMKWWDHAQEKLSQAESSARFSLMVSPFPDPYDTALRVESEGKEGTLDYRVRFYHDSMQSKSTKQISPWHDIPLYVAPAGVGVMGGKSLNRFNFLCEIPKWSRAKFEIATSERFNPVKQDVKNGVLRYYKHGDMLFNYGAFPRTWEDPSHKWKDTDGTEYGGDNDPVDVIEIGMQRVPTGGVAEVKILGVLGMVDSGEMDWKVIAIQVTDQMANIVDDIPDVERYIPGALDSLREWLRSYKVCVGGDPSKFLDGGKYFSRDYALSVIDATHSSWKQLTVAREQKEV